MLLFTVLPQKESNVLGKISTKWYYILNAGLGMTIDIEKRPSRHGSDVLPDLIEYSLDSMSRVGE